MRLNMDIVPHPADWRGGLGWLVGRYPEFFDPPNPRADAMAGCGAYSADERHFDTTNLRRMAFRINWKCSEDFAYMGMFLPPMPNDMATWQRGSDEPPIAGKSAFNSYKSLNDYSRWMREQGLYVLNYFNVTEFGRNMRWPVPLRKTATDADALERPERFPLFEPREGPAACRRPARCTCYHAFVVDVGETGFQRFILAQARRHIEKLPDSAGICIDRLDWLRYYNPRGDDGVSWVDGKPARSLYMSWRDFMARVGPMMHKADKVIFVNNHEKRLELLKGVDGVYCEFCQTGPALNSTGLLTLRKPGVGWTPDAGTLRPTRTLSSSATCTWAFTLPCRIQETTTASSRTPGPRGISDGIMGHCWMRFAASSGCWRRTPSKRRARPRSTCLRSRAVMRCPSPLPGR